MFAKTKHTTIHKMLYSLATPPAAAPTNNNTVTVNKTFFVDIEEQQQQIVSSIDPTEKLNKLDNVNQMEF